MHRFATMSRMFLLMSLRERETLFWLFLFPIGLMALLTVANSGGDNSVTAVAGWLMSGVLVMNIMSNGINGDANWLATMRDRGVLWRLRAAPLAPRTLVASFSLVKLGLVVLQSALIVATAIILFGVRPQPGVALPALGVVLLGGGVFILLGQALAAVAPSGSAANVLSSMIFFPVLFLSNLVIQLESFPDWLMTIARWSPATMLVDLLRPLLTPEAAMQPAWMNVAGLLVYAAIAVGITARWFRWQSHTACWAPSGDFPGRARGHLPAVRKSLLPGLAAMIYHTPGAIPRATLDARGGKG